MLLPINSAVAFELLGIDVINTRKDAFRQALKATGVELISEAGEDQFFDSYSSQNLLPGSKRLYLGFVKKDDRFAFAEYEFMGLQQSLLLNKLTEKYGRYREHKGRFLSDFEYLWSQNGINISLMTDWDQYRTRLIYAHPEALTALQQEFLEYQQKNRKASSTFNLNAF